MYRFREMMAQVPKKVISRKTRLKFLLFIWQLSDLEVHISKNKRDIENTFGTVIPYEYSYKKMQNKIIDYMKILYWWGPLKFLLYM